MKRTLILFTLFLSLSPLARAHPVPKDAYDRTIVVHLEKHPKAGHGFVRVNYRLEVDPFTVFTRDMEPYRDVVDFFAYRGKELEYYREFTKIYAPVFAEHLDVRFNGKSLLLQCVKHEPALKDEKGEDLGHVRGDFVYEAEFPWSADQAMEITFVDRTYQFQEGEIRANLSNDAGYEIRWHAESSEEVRKRAKLERQPGDDAILRTVKVTFAVPKAWHPDPIVPPTPGPAPTKSTSGDTFRLSRLFFSGQQGFWLTMLFSFFFGGAHALTPGHGKTLVAAYLIGERGTIWHAMLLGVVTTLTHTGIVLLLALVLFFLPRPMQESFQQWMHQGLSLAMGLTVVCLGFWLLLQRLAGKADHVHLGGGHHHHHHGDSADHVHLPPTLDSERKVHLGSLIILGITGGLVPCWDAVVLLANMVGHRQFMLALPAVLFFSLGLAGVLVLIGVLVVQVPRFAKTGSGRWTKLLPFLSAVFIILMGVWLCYEGVHGSPE